MFAAIQDPRKKTVPPKIEPVAPYLSFAPLENGADALARSAERYEKALAKLTANGGAALARASLDDVNRKLIASERALTDSRGLPNRPWFKHQIYAPGFYTGYAVKTIPAVREAIEQKHWSDADPAIALVGRTLANEAALIEQAAADLEKAAQ